MHLRAASRGDNQSNRILSQAFATPIPAGAQHVSIRVKARWLRGHPELLVRLHGGGAEAFGRLHVPSRLGTPGLRNSIYRSNTGPAVYQVQHTPVLPAGNQPVVVTARATDPQGVAVVNLRSRIDPQAGYGTVPMRDDGTAGDAVANDGLYTATIGGQGAGVMAAFFVEAQDGQGLVGTFPQAVFPAAGLTRCWPNDAVARECVVRWGEVQMAGPFATYHLWVTSANSNRWHHRDPMNNTPMDGTFVYNNTRAIYNALPLYSGSPWHRTNSTTGPAGINRVDYEMNFPDEDPLLGATDFILNNPGNPDILTISDLSAVVEQAVYKIFEQMDMVHNNRRYIHFFVNGSQRSIAYERPGNFIFEDSQQPNGDMLSQWFPTDPDGPLYKIEDWFEFAPNGFDITAHNDGDFGRREIVVAGEPKLALAPYRFMFRKRSVAAGESANDYSRLFEIIDAVSPADNPTNTTVDPVALGAVVDWEQWMRVLALQRAVNNFDSYGWERGKNCYFYAPLSGRAQLMTWDIDYGLSLSGRGPTEPLFTSNDPRMRAMFNTPAIVRAYWRTFQELVAGPFKTSALEGFIDVRVAALQAAAVNIDTTAVAALKSFIDSRRAFLMDQLGTISATFAVNGPLSFTTTNNLVLIRGTAPVDVRTFTVNGAPALVEWTSVTNFVLRAILVPGVNSLVLAGVDRFGAAVPGTSRSFSITYSGPNAGPVGAIVINEISAQSSAPGPAFVEFHNRSLQSFDISGWRVEELGYEFPAGTLMTNAQHLVLARNKAAFAQAHGPNKLAFDAFPRELNPQGQVVSLVRPSPGLLVDRVRYSALPPWPEGPGSLQLVDGAQDNSRVSNWRNAGPTPNAVNSVVGSLVPYEPLWLNEVQPDNVYGPPDNAGENHPWIELYNSGSTTLTLAGYYLTTNYSFNLTQWAFPADASIPPGQFRLIWADGQPAQSSGTNLHTNFRLGTNGMLGLTRLINGTPQIVDYLTWPLLRPAAAYGKLPDGDPFNEQVLFEATPRGVNRHSFPPLFINEWMARNTAGIRDAAGDLEDWFEIYNAADTPFDLGGYYLTDSGSQPTKYQVPATGQYVVPPRGFLHVWADDEPVENGPGLELHASFKLASSSSSIAIYRPDGATLVNSINYGTQNNNISEGRFPNGATNRFYMNTPTPRGGNVLDNNNRPPVIAYIPNQAVRAGQPLQFAVGASDLDIPAQILSYSLVAEPGLGATVAASTGAFSWTPGLNLASSSHVLTLVVVDNGSPQARAEQTFKVTVLPPLLATATWCGPDAVTLNFPATPGGRYRVDFKDNFTGAAWLPLTPDIISSGSSFAVSDMFSGRAQRFYRLVDLPD